MAKKMHRVMMPHKPLEYSFISKTPGKTKSSHKRFRAVTHDVFKHLRMLGILQQGQ
jgi:hypothetical protein